VRRQLARNTGVVTPVAFASDGRTLVSGSDDTTILVWTWLAGMKAAPPG